MGEREIRKGMWVESTGVHFIYTCEIVKLIKELKKTNMFWFPVCGKAPLNMMHYMAFCLQSWISPLMCFFSGCSLDIPFTLTSSLQGRSPSLGIFM